MRKTQLRRLTLVTVRVIIVLACITQASFAKSAYENLIKGLDFDYANEDLKALEYYKKAQIQYLELDSLGRYSLVTLNIASLHYEYGLYEKSIEVYFDALEHIENQKFKALLFRNLAKSYKKLGNIPDAFNYYFKSESLCKFINDSSGLAKSYRDIATLLYEGGEYESSKEYFLKHLDLAIPLKKNYQARKTYNDLALIEMNQGNFETAVSYFSNSISGEEDSVKLGNRLGNLGLLQIKNGNIEDGIANLTESAKFFDESDSSNELMINTYRELAILGVEDFGQRYAVYSNVNVKRSERFESEYDSIKLSYEDQIQTSLSKLRRNKNIIVYSWTAFATLLGLFTVLYRRVQNKEKKRKEKDKENDDFIDDTINKL